MTTLPALRPTRLLSLLKAAPVVGLAGLGFAHAMTYHISYLEDEGKRAQITQVMNEAVAVYNSTTDINVDINVIYHSGIPTAQSDYNGQLGFGGSISTQVAIHEIAHYLGSGTTGEWDANFGGGNVWNGPALKRYVKLFDGPGAEIYRSGVHYYPYGFNYGNEDNPTARYRIGRILRAMRMDMGGQDGDGDGMPDEWERFKSGSTALKVGGDADGDGISDYDEWWTDSNPMWACPVKTGHIYQIRSRLSQKLMEVDGLDAGANVRQNPNNGSDLQKWVATYVGGGYWKFVNLASGKCPDVLNYSWDPANIIAWNDTGGANQQWRIFPGASGGAYWKMGNRNSTNMVIDVDGGPNATGDNTNIGQYFDDMNAFNQDWAFDDVTPGVQTDGLVANYKFEGNGRDNSSHNFFGVATGGITYAAGRVDGLAATFNGTNGSISVPATVDRNFSLACWVKTTATAGTGQWYNGMGLIDADMPGVAKDFGLAMLGNKAAFGVGNPEVTISSSNAINDGFWHHIVATLDTGTGAMKLYVDGVLSGSGTGPAAPRTAPASFSLGSVGGTAGFFNGSLDEARLYNKILSPEEINRLANVGNSLVASYSFDGDARDATLFDNHGDGVGVTYAAGKVGTGAAQFDGTSSFVKIPAPATADFSVAYWFKTTATGGTGQWYAGKSMVDADVPGIANDWGISLVGDKVGFGMGNAGAGTTIVSTAPINNGAWHHVVATRVNGTGAMNLYIDGTLQASGTGSTAVRDGPGGIRVGSTLFGGTYFTGAIDDLKIFNYALNGQQVSALVTPVGAPWTATDVGNPGSDGYTGYATVSDGTYTVIGGGTDIGGSADQFQFVSTPASGDQTLVTRVASLPLNNDGTTTAGSKAGLMFRDSTGAGSAFAGVFYDNLNGLRFLTRDAPDASATQTGNTVSLAVPMWLKITRIGDGFEAFYATTASQPASENWISLGVHATPLAANPLAGMALTSHKPLQVARVAFTGTAITPPSAGDAWRFARFGTAVNSGQSADAADLDGDGLNNLLERALALDPAVPNGSAGLTVFGNSDTYLTLTYARNLAATDLNYQVVWSSDLVNWSPVDVQDTVTGTTSTTEIHEAKVLRSSVGPGSGFLRLQVR